MHFRHLLLPAVLLPLGLLAETAVYTNAEPIHVAAPRLSPERVSSSGWDAASRFESVPFVSVRQQGLRSAQGDLSVRGGAFNTSGMLLQGIAVKNPQTEHFQGDLDLPDDYFERPEVATGMERFSRSSSHPSGAVVLDLAPIAQRGRLILGGGEAGQRSVRLEQGVAAIPEVPNLKLSVFAGWDAIDRTDRQPDNDLQRQSVGGRGEYRLDDGVVDVLLTASHREFGARGFYGTPTELPSDEQVANILGLVSYRRGDRETRDYERVTAAFNRVDDTYWYYGRDQGAASEHRSDVLAFHGDLSRPITDSLDLLLRGDLNSEQLRSRSLGDHQRTSSSFAALPTWRYGSFAFTAGGAVELFEDDKPGWLPALGVTCRLNAEHSLFANYSEAIRLPSYTEYNYNNPTSLGNQGLERQQTRTAEAGWQGAWSAAQAGLTCFAEQGRNSVDWLRLNRDDTTFQAVNIESLRRYGVAWELAFNAGRQVDVRLSGLSQYQTCDTDYYASRYLMDYVQHELKAECIWQVARNWNARLWQSVQQMEDNPLRNHGRSHWLMGSAVRWQVAGMESVTLTLGVSNLLDDDFEVFVGQPEAGRRCYALAEYRW